MPSPPIQIFLTTIASQPALRQRQEYILRILQVKKIVYTSYDLASDEAAKRLWKRKTPVDKQQLPGILVGGVYPGTFSEFEDAVEYDELSRFFRLDEEWHEDIDGPKVLEQKAIGVPGASMPSQMTPERLNVKIRATMHSPSPLSKKSIPVNKRTDEFDIGEELSGFGLQGVQVTEDELADLVKELGLDGDDAGDLVKGLTGGDEKSPAAADQEERDFFYKEDAAEEKSLPDDKRPSSISGAPETKAETASDFSGSSAASKPHADSPKDKDAEREAVLDG